MFKNWSNRDWVWLTGILLFIMTLLVANFYEKWDPQISIIANSTSIALAVIAIFLSLKQDSDSKSTSESMRQDLSTQMGNITMLIASKRNEIDDAATNVEQSVDTNTETRNDSYTYEQLVEHGEKIKQETINKFKIEMNEKILNNSDLMNDAYKNYYLKKFEYRDVEDEIIKTFKENPHYTFNKLNSELKKKGIDVSNGYIKTVLDRRQ
ncbi:hypothetical protein LZ480_07650 [Solibacillus sp. MA9]|uniref:Uncharacterized protein n=1 Tax=Solibacillus palustris TaxID=2908203 RepID=A0ABS9UBN7_9BACL|nr:hypothetical protein [Solibacillus sp. MA9]MCH7321766.1 hypothetical protein [Solibacillus sp. MA9]